MTPGAVPGAPFQIFPISWSPGAGEVPFCGPGALAWHPLDPLVSHICQRILPFGGLAGGLVGRPRQLTADLGDDISSEHRVLVCYMGQVGGQQVDESLNLVHHGIHVGHLQPVLDGGDSAWANHPVDFFMKFLCQDMNRIDAEDGLQAGSAPPPIHPAQAYRAFPAVLQGVLDTLDSGVIAPQMPVRASRCETPQVFSTC